MRTIYFQTEYVCLWFDEARHIGGGIWTGQLPSKPFREAFQKSYQLVAEKKLTKWVADNRKMKAISTDDQQWILKQVPLIITAGLKQMATIVSEDIFHHMSIVDLFDRASGIITFQNHYFKNEEEALEWLNVNEPAISKF